ncbi:MAG: flagellar motor protein [Zoogloeaceae bacterium]|jgi:chemotaxis protein MotA|nr:flagellar motor protein [Zoogloeaceae bacterium]
MDKQSIIGLLIGVGAILLGHVLENGRIDALMQLVQPSALVIVLGGTLGAVLLQTPFNYFWRGVGMLAWIFRPPKVDYPRQIERIVQWSFFSRREGLLALENFANKTNDPLERKGLQLLVDGIDVERLRDILDAGFRTQDMEYRQAARIWEAAGGYSPTIGILGAVLGLIHVMNNLADPTKLGAGIAVAFVATIYGVGLANLVYLPIANKLKVHIGRLMRSREVLIEGLLGIAMGESPRVIEGRLVGYLNQDEQPKNRVNISRLAKMEKGHAS